MIPARRPHQTFADHQCDVALWLGYQGDDAVAQMNAAHDPLHARLCDWLGIPSHSMREARGEKLNAADQELAWAEETAVLHVQRLVQMHRRTA